MRTTSRAWVCASSRPGLSPKTNVATCIGLINEFTVRLQQFDYHQVVAYASELSNKFGITNFDVRVTRQRRMPSAFKSSHVLSTTGQNRSCDTDELTAQLHQVLGQISSEIRHRFADDQIGIMSTAGAVCLLQKSSCASKQPAVCKSVLSASKISCTGRFQSIRSSPEHQRNEVTEWCPGCYRQRHFSFRVLRLSHSCHNSADLVHGGAIVFVSETNQNENSVAHDYIKTKQLGSSLVREGLDLLFELWRHPFGIQDNESPSIVLLIVSMNQH